MFSYKRQKQLVVVGFLIIPLTLLVTFSFYPAVKLLYLSFTSWDGLSHSYPWVGFHNYKVIFTNGSMFAVFKHNFAYFIGGIVQNILALYFAIVLNSRIRARNFWRSPVPPVRAEQCCYCLYVQICLSGYGGPKSTASTHRVAGSCTQLVG